MADPETTITSPAVAPATSGTPAPEAPAAPAAPDVKQLAEEAARLRKHNDQLLKEKKNAEAGKKAESERLAKLAELLGVSSTEDPAAIAAKREAETRAARDRESRIEREILRSLLGKPGLTAEDAEYLAWKANKAESVLLDETGSLVGLNELLEAELAKPRFAAPKPPTPNSPPAKVPSDAVVPTAPLDPRLAGIKTPNDFFRLPVIVQVELQAKHPKEVAAILGRSV